MRCAVVTLFPDMVAPVIGHSILKRAQEKGLLEVTVENLRDHTFDRHKTADDVPYGGGAGMVMKAEPVLRAIDSLRTRYQTAHPGTTLRVIVPSPQGRPFTQELAQSLAQDERVVVFVCGHYEGMDERVRLALHPEEISVGDYVLTGGELPALVMIDAAARLVPGVLGDAASAAEESLPRGSWNIRTTRGRQTCAGWRSLRCWFRGTMRRFDCGVGRKRCGIRISSDRTCYGIVSWDWKIDGY